MFDYMERPVCQTCMEEFAQANMHDMALRLLIKWQL